MIALRMIAPILTGFTTVAGAGDRDPASYRAVWTNADARLEDLRGRPGIAAIRLNHLEENGRKSLYSSIETDSLPRAAQLVTVQMDPAAGKWPAAPAWLSAVDEVTVEVYSHGVSLMEISLLLEEPPEEGREDWLDRMQGEAVGYAEELGELILADVMKPLLDALAEADPKSGTFHLEAADATPPRVLWVSRSLLVDQANRNLLLHWTKDSVDDASAHLRDELQAGSRHSLVRWLNYGFVDVDGVGAAALRTGRHAAEFSGLRYAQETYASLDVVDSRLRLVLADAAAASTKWELEQLRGDLVWLSLRAELIIMGRHELGKYMTRAVRAHFDRIMDGWDYEVLIEEPARFKIELCNRRLDDLAARRAARSGRVTDLILMGIGITSIASIALAISQFGRSAASDPLATGYDLGASDFTSWFAAQPVDVILLASAAASAVLVVLYLYFRRDDGAS